MVTVLALLSNSLRKEGNGSRSYLCEAQLRPGLPPPCSCLPALLRLRPGETTPCRNGQCRASIDCWAGGRSLCAEGVAWGGPFPVGLGVWVLSHPSHWLRSVSLGHGAADGSRHSCSSVRRSGRPEGWRRVAPAWWMRSASPRPAPSHLCVFS